MIAMGAGLDRHDCNHQREARLREIMNQAIEPARIAPRKTR